MMSVRIAVYGDGKHELGPTPGTPVSGDDLPALPRIVARLLSEPPDVQYVPLRFADVPHVAGKGPKLGRKLQRAILLARVQGYDGLVVLIDKDRMQDRSQAKPLKDARDDMRMDRTYAPCAVGVAVETFDAWMIADGTAVSLSGGDGAKCHPQPECLCGKEGTGKHPKDRAAEVFGSGQGLGDKYARVAFHMDLDRLSRSCPQGFPPFAAEVKSHIGVVLA